MDISASLTSIRDNLHRIERDLAQLRTHLDTRLNRNHERQDRMSQQMDDLKAKVAANGDVIAAAVMLLQGLKARLDAAIAAGADPAMLQALSDDLGAQDKALADAVVANTPAA